MPDSIMFMMFLIALLLVVTAGVGYKVILWLMYRDCEFELHESDYGTDLNSNQTREKNLIEGEYKRLN